MTTNKKSEKDEKVYPLVMRKDLYKEVEEVAYSNDISVAHFIRESVKLNLKEYKRKNQ